jgi:hypothetical protein
MPLIRWAQLFQAGPNQPDPVFLLGRFAHREEAPAE